MSRSSPRSPVADGDPPAIGFFHFDIHLQRVEVRDLGQIHAGENVVPDLERPYIIPSLRVVRSIIGNAGDGRPDFHLSDAVVGDIDVGLSLIAQAGGAGDLRFVGRRVQGDGSILGRRPLPGGPRSPALARWRARRNAV